MQETLEKVEFYVKPIVANLDLELWGIEIQSAAKTVVRIFLENAGIDECTQVSRLLGLALDVEEVFNTPWVLEISTPGLDRTFFKLEQLSSFIGETLSITLLGPINTEKLGNRKKMQAVLTSVADSSFCVHLNDVELGEELEIAWKNVKKAKIIPSFEEPEKPITKQKKETKKK